MLRKVRIRLRLLKRMRRYCVPFKVSPNSDARRLEAVKDGHIGLGQCVLHTELAPRYGPDDVQKWRCFCSRFR